MHLVLLHGYLLRGTGSNVYVANVAKAWCKQGHAVTIVCQEREAGSLPFVDEALLPDDRWPATPPAEGKLRVVVPDIEGLLPVFVVDRYEGYEVKTLPDMSAAEIDRHISLAAAGLRRVVAVGADRVLANHVLLNPVIACRGLAGTGVPYDVKVHGSGLEFALAPAPRLMPYAVEGLGAAERIFAGSRHIRERVLDEFAAYRQELDLDSKLHIVPPGMDPDLFIPCDDRGASERHLLDAVRVKIGERGSGRRADTVQVVSASATDALHESLVAAAETYDQLAPDADLPERWRPVGRDEPVICYVGKFLDTKGVGELLLTFPSVLARIPESRLVLIGFGSYREHLEGMTRALRDGDLEAFVGCARAGGFVDEADLARWFRPLDAEQAARIMITGMLDHDCLRHALPMATVSVVPSKGAEAFGMVAAEAMAAGVLPLCNYDTGLRDVVDQVATVAPELAALMKVPRANFVDELPDRICAALAYLYPDGYASHVHRRKVGMRLREIAVERFSWNGIACRLIEPSDTDVV